MRQILISGLMVLSAMGMAAASERYPSAKRYVNQTAQVVNIGRASQVVAIAQLPKQLRLVKVLAEVRVVHAVEAPLVVRSAPRLVAVRSFRAEATGVFSAVNTDPANWPSGRKCCLSGQPYFNEEPNS